MPLNLLKLPPKGIDAAIQRHQGGLYRYVRDEYCGILGDNDYQCYGRCYVNEDSTGFVPEVYVNIGEYREVLLDDTKMLLSFYGVSNDIEHHGGGVCSTDVHIVFFANVQRLEEHTAHMPDEEVRRKVFKALRKLAWGFELKEQVKGVKDSLEEYTSDKVKNLKADMRPWHVFRFNFRVTFYPEE